MRRCGLFLLLYLLCGPTAVAQNIMLQGRLLDARTSVPVSGATVEILSLGDTLTYRATTGVEGTFRINLIRSIGKYALLVQKPGYADYLKVIQIESTVTDLGNVAMVDSARLLKETVVKAKRKAFTVKGDTVEYSSSYYKTNPDMDAVYLINKMPGIDLLNRRANGDSVSGIAINGLVIFGDRSREILAQLPAGLVEKVQVYTDSASMLDGGAGATRRTKIINVKTTDRALRRPKGKALAGGGTSGVFNTGANAIRQRDRAQASVDVSATRGGVRNAAYYDPSFPFQASGIPLTARLSFNATQPLSARDQLGLDFSTNADRHRLIRTTLDQFSLGDESSSIRTRTDGTKDRFSSGLEAKWVRTPVNGARLQVGSFLRTDHTRSDDAVDIYSSIAGAASESRSATHTVRRLPSAGASVRYATSARNKMSYTSSAYYSHAAASEKTTAEGYNRTDSVTVPTDFLTAATRRTDNLGAGFGAKHTRSARHAVSCNLSSSYDVHRAAQRRDFFSEATQAYSILDSLFSTRADYSILNSSAEAKSVWTLDSGKTTVEGGAGVQYFNTRERSGLFTKAYFTVNPFLRYNKRYTAQKELELRVAKSNELPTYEDLNPVLIAASPYFYRVGNLDLRPAQRFDISASFRGGFLLDQSVFNTSAGAIYMRNYIVRSAILPAPGEYFFEGKPIPVGAQLTYVQNFGAYRYLYSRFGFDAPVSRLKMVVKFNTGATLRSADAMLNGVPVNTTSYTYAASSTFNSVISTRLDFVAYLGYDFNRTVQDGGGAVAAQDVHRWMFNSLLTVQLDKRQTLKAETSMNLTTGLPASRPTRFYMLDLSYNVKLLRSQKFSLGTTLHDVFDSYRSFGFEANPFYDVAYRVNAVHSFETNAIGRYLLLMAGYAF